MAAIFFFLAHVWELGWERKKNGVKMFDVSLIFIGLEMLTNEEDGWRPGLQGVLATVGSSREKQVSTKWILLQQFKKQNGGWAFPRGWDIALNVMWSSQKGILIVSAV